MKKNTHIRPFLKWAGGKFAVLPHLKKVLPPGKRLIEPFVGSGAVFLNTDYPQYLLADANQDLILLYQQLQWGNKSFIKDCQQYFCQQNNIKTVFYQLRDKFNASQDVKERSALFIYLNRHGYNGLCRYNSDGTFNVPFGYYTAPKLSQVSLQHFFEKAKISEFIHADFTETLKQAKKGDVIYCDPPYVPLSKTAYFTAYNALSFDTDNQIQLATMAKQLANRNIPVIVSNHDTEFTRELYQGAKIISIDVQRVISCQINNRKKVKELLAVFN